MSFIIEVLPKKENGNVFVYVVRSGNGYPMSVCDSLDGICQGRILHIRRV